MAEYTNIETAMSIICDMCECLYPGLFCPEKPNLGNNLGKCDRRKHLEEDAADVAPVVHGQWKASGGLLECQNCGEIYSTLGGNEGKAWDYCPDCGARMDGVSYAKAD